MRKKHLYGLVAAGLLFAVKAGSAAEPPALLTEAFRRGVVDVQSYAALPGEDADMFKAIQRLRPGLVNNIAYYWEGLTTERLREAAGKRVWIRTASPKTLVVGSWSETIAPDFSETFDCPLSQKAERFTATELTAGKVLGPHNDWLDLARSETADYLGCTGALMIDNGFDVLNIQQGGNLLKNSSDRLSAQKNLVRLQTELNSYAANKGVHLYWQADPDTSHVISIDISMVPARLYHTFTPEYFKYQNKIEQPGVGNGYTYALSPRMVADAKAALPEGVMSTFAIDNWDPRQDDLRRMMELEPENRRSLLLKSAEAAAAGGAFFILPLNKCAGCVKPDAVQDKCELLPNGSTEYNAVRCGDLDVIESALRIK